VILHHKKTQIRRNPQPTTDDVVAALTFGFWTNFFPTLSPIDAPPVIAQIFPNHPTLKSKQWGNSQKRHQLGQHLQIANFFRNRVAHHEPLFKFRYQGTYPQRLAQGLTNLQGCMDHCLVISGWIDAAAELALRQSGWFQHFQVLSTETCFNDWVRNGNPPAYTHVV
jgi:Abi-like protein